MPKGPKGEKRPSDALGAAVMVAKIATGEIEKSPTMTVRTRLRRLLAGGAVPRGRRS